MKPKPIDPIAILNEEIADYTKQLGEAQQQAAIWNQKVMVTSGALQACQALLQKLEAPSEESAPAPTA